MDVPVMGWIGLGILVIILISVDIFGHIRQPHEPTMKESSLWTIGYITLAVVFGLIVQFFYGANYAGQYYAGWMTEWSLSLDNLFVFVIIMNSFRVPRQAQQKALLFGIIVALVLRLIFILIGGALIARFSFIFFFFGIWLIYAAISQLREGVKSREEPEESPDAAFNMENRFIHLVRKVVPITDSYYGQKLLYRHGGRTFVTPLVLVIFALGSADLMFAFDSIPAIFGLTSEPFLVFACNAFALLGLRQLYFLIDGLLDKLVYLHYGLAVILGFIGIKLILQSLHENTLPFINGGEGYKNIPEIGIPVSLAVIGGTLLITVVASLLTSHRHSKQMAE